MTAITTSSVYDFLIFLIRILLVCFAISLICIKDFRTIVFGGLKNILLRDVSKTPEGARAIYEAATEEARKQYQAAADAHATLSGQLRTAKSKLADANTDVQKCEERAARAYNAGRIDDAREIAEHRATALKDVEFYQSQVSRLEPQVKETAKLMNDKEREIELLQRESKQKVSQLQYAAVMAKANKSLDKLRQDQSASRLRQMVNESVDEATAMAEGYHQTYEAKLSTRSERLMERNDTSAVDDFMQKLARESAKKS